MFGFNKKDPVCGMKEEEGKGVKKNGNWFCSQKCLKEYEEQFRGGKKKGCC